MRAYSNMQALSLNDLRKHNKKGGKLPKSLPSFLFFYPQPLKKLKSKNFALFVYMFPQTNLVNFTALVESNNFFSSVQQLENPKLSTKKQLKYPKPSKMFFQAFKRS